MGKKMIDHEVDKNLWALREPPENFYALGEQKYYKTIDFLSTRLLGDLIASKKIKYSHKITASLKNKKAELARTFEDQQWSLQYWCQIYVTYKKTIDKYFDFDLESKHVKQYLDYCWRSTFTQKEKKYDDNVVCLNAYRDKKGAA